MGVELCYAYIVFVNSGFVVTTCGFPIFSEDHDASKRKVGSICNICKMLGGVIIHCKLIESTGVKESSESQVPFRTATANDYFSGRRTPSRVPYP